jgi:hypothetical protein
MVDSCWGQLIAAMDLGAAVSVFSTKLFHSLQAGQQPIHLGLSLPHCWQTKTTRDFFTG